MIHCKDCRYFEERKDQRYDDGLCTITLPWWITVVDYDRAYRKTRETDGCDLGQPKEENGE